jgi:uncharacterized membrane protein YkvA (DUF1232 family)
MNETPQASPASGVEAKPGKLGAVLMLVGALIYLVSPVDVLPDVLPLLGQIDDLGILGMAARHAYKAFS